MPDFPVQAKIVLQHGVEEYALQLLLRLLSALLRGIRPGGDGDQVGQGKPGFNLTVLFVSFRAIGTCAFVA